MFGQFELTEFLVTAVLFFIVANPMTFKLVNSLLGKIVKTANGAVPTTAGLMVHAVLFILLSDTVHRMV